MLQRQFLKLCRFSYAYFAGVEATGAGAAGFLKAMYKAPATRPTMSRVLRFLFILGCQLLNYVLSCFWLCYKVSGFAFVREKSLYHGHCHYTLLNYHQS